MSLNLPESLSVGSAVPYSLITPLWIDLITTDAGSIYYRTTENASILDKVVEMITDVNSNYSDYQPSLAVIVTWDDVPLFSDSSKHVSTYDSKFRLNRCYDSNNK